ncbi:hypothetical protein J2Y69_003068 [Microbacterium resistens]|uniref:Tail terminator n=1 Tax=Microbacterium resistens TaxID=156977 RepID=A0ABU1SFQ3_9MICO|nr:hypothetical protein [Microbacterium resistens]MDR6868452.1 hypothetical protein [Microbacterium resistens]
MNRYAHFEAIIARARERGAPPVHDSNAPLNSDGTVVRSSYVVLHDLGPDEIGDDRYTAADDVTAARTMRIVARCVGEDPAAVRRVADAMIAQLVGWTPVVPGRVCWPIRLDDEGEVEDDQKVSPPLPFIDLDLIYRSTPEG